ncbi:putative glycine dehydrogenase (decarboxylating) subunit 1 [Desulfosarcina ovata subsp. sediminis]|uniref:Putative glycine dehydrogenase (Decarboxylating) subunit 1 n=3 Tax=Desulfosarcina ovata TaxID=83564 RepID=A0A5K8A458_9BACT|nr:putative glycine dehydrogenase (decarboxylating) subunit 1 [Desulfosarcina ovata subsp. sediminis]BBO87198.1 putative glycine dehydrogenase (decarboxylating) subunit 1 [Desulfosarcina ovata subsp. ovata]
MNALGVTEIMDLFEAIPDHLKYTAPLDLPEPIRDEYSIRRHLETLLNRNRNCQDFINFLGAGCAQHFVPAVCDEVSGRGEFLTAYAAEFYADHGKWQALFEFCSLLAELLDVDVTSGFLYDGLQAVATSLRMACRMTGRNEILIPGTVSRDARRVLDNYMAGIQGPQFHIRTIGFDRESGQMDLADLSARISKKTAAVFVENPSYLGFIEPQVEAIGEIARRHGSEFVVSTDPISLGVLAPPAQYGATITCGDYHPLGLHMQCGGGQSGFIGTSGEMRYVMEYKDKMYGLTPTSVAGEHGFANILFERTSFGSREKAREFTGTSNALWAITAGAYLALMGPKGMAEVGQTIMQKAQYAAAGISRINGVRLGLSGPFFKEFIVNFDGTGKRVADINRKLLDHQIFGGKDLSSEFGMMGESALFCVTEVISQASIDCLVDALTAILA